MKRQNVNGKQQLTRKESAFVENVAAGENQTTAVVKAGYSKKSAKIIGSQLVNKTIVQDAIRERKNQAYSANHLCAQMVVGGLNEIAFAPVDLLIRDDGSVDLGEAKRLGLTHLIKKMRLTQTPFGQRTEVEFYSRIEALKKLADIGQIQLPQQDLEDERLRASFARMIENHATRNNTSLDEARRFFLTYSKEDDPDFYDSLMRAGIEPLNEDTEG